MGVLDDGPDYVYLNRELTWPRFTLNDLEVDPSGRMALVRVPRKVSSLARPNGDAIVPPPDLGPSGIAVSACERYLFAAEPASGRVWVNDSCESGPRTYSWPGRGICPRGLAADHGPRLYVADSKNHQVLRLDVASGQPLPSWGKGAAAGRPEAGTDPGEFDEPWDLAVDHSGYVYVVEFSGRRLQKLDPGGAADLAFAPNLAAHADPTRRPVRVAIAGNEEAARLYILQWGDDGHAYLLRIHPDGTPDAESPWAAPLPVDRPLSLAVTEQGVFLGTDDGSLLGFDLAGKPLRTASVSDRPILGLTAVAGGDLLAGSGGLRVHRVRPGAGYLRMGTFVAGPFRVQAKPLAWHRWRTEADTFGPPASLRLYAFVGDPGATPPAPALTDTPFQEGRGTWRASPADLLDTLILDDTLRDLLDGVPVDLNAADPDAAEVPSDLWLGGVLQGDGLVSPSVAQMRLDFSPETMSGHLPSPYRSGSLMPADPSSGTLAMEQSRRSALLSRMSLSLLLALAEGSLGEVGKALRELPSEIDPRSAPAAWLPWLASWIDFDWLDEWPEDQARKYLGEAVAFDRIRGTAEGLRKALKMYAGVDARVEESRAGPWFVLDDSVALGFSTRLAAAHEMGAVLDSSATLGQTHIVDPPEMGAPLFAADTHRIFVHVHQFQAKTDQARARLLSVLDREVPAHVEARLCVIPPRMRVGAQARLGIDTVVGFSDPPYALGSNAALGVETPLGKPRSSRLGRDTRVGDSLGPLLLGVPL